MGHDKWDSKRHKTENDVVTYMLQNIMVEGDKFVFCFLG